METENERNGRETYFHHHQQVKRLRSARFGQSGNTTSVILKIRFACSDRINPLITLLDNFEARSIQQSRVLRRAFFSYN